MMSPSRFIDPQVMIGACNPHIAHRAMGIDSRIPTLLPCNVIVRTNGERTTVEALDPTIMATLSDDPGLAAIAEDAATRIQAALDTIQHR